MASGGMTDRNKHLIGASDETPIGNVGDRLKVDASFSNQGDLSPLGRLRVSIHSVYFIFSFSRTWENSFEVFDSQLTSGGTVTDIENQSSVSLNVTSSATSKTIIETTRYFPYFPGRESSILITGNLNGGVTGVRKRLGLFDDKNGIFFQLVDSTLSIVIRSDVTGSVVDTVVNQSSWSQDKLDGTGVSGLTFDTTKQTIFFFEYIWLGSGPINFGVYIGDKKVYVHKYSGSNIASKIWCSSPVLPLRYECEKLSGSNTASLLVTCMSISFEGQTEPNAGFDAFYINNKLNEKTFTNETPIFSIRLNPNTNRAIIVPTLIDLIMTAGTKFAYWYILKNATTLTDVSWQNVGIFSQYDKATTSFSGGYKVYESYLNVSGSTSVQESELLNSNKLYLSRLLNGNSETLTLVISTSGGSSKLVWSSEVREFLK